MVDYSKQVISWTLDSQCGFDWCTRHFYLTHMTRLSGVCWI